MGSWCEFWATRVTKQVTLQGTGEQLILLSKAAVNTCLIKTSKVANDLKTLKPIIAILLLKELALSLGCLGWASATWRSCSPLLLLAPALNRIVQIKSSGKIELDFLACWELFSPSCTIKEAGNSDQKAACGGLVPWEVLMHQKTWWSKRNVVHNLLSRCALTWVLAGRSHCCNTDITSVLSSETIL